MSKPQTWGVARALPQAGMGQAFGPLHFERRTHAHRVHCMKHQATMAEAPFIELDRVSKRFGGVTALDQVSFEIRCGEVHAVVGENGAGKSTLMKLLAGVHEPDDGEIRLAGLGVRLKNAREARGQGISIVFQELNLFPHRTVAANVFANREVTRRWGW